MNIFLSKLLSIIVLLGIVLGAIWIFFQTFFILLPFIIAYFLSKPLSRLSFRLSLKTKLPRTMVAFFLSMAAIALFLSSIIFLLYRGVQQSQALRSEWPTYVYEINLLAENMKTIEILLPWRDSPIILTELFVQFYNLLFESISQMANRSIGIVFSALKMIPNIGLFVFFILLSLYFFTKEQHRIQDFFRKIMLKYEPPLFHEVKIHAKQTFKNYFKALLTLVFISFCISIVGLGILGIPFFPLIAIAIAIVDFIPVIGPATIYIPWILFLMLTGQYRLAVILSILYVITTMTRQILEPKIISEKIGSNPLITIVAMYVCFRLIGAIGFLLGPIIVVVGVIIYRSYLQAKESV